jgi:hypothetical protein
MSSGNGPPVSIIELRTSVRTAISPRSGELNQVELHPRAAGGRQSRFAIGRERQASSELLVMIQLKMPRPRSANDLFTVLTSRAAGRPSKRTGVTGPCHLVLKLLIFARLSPGAGLPIHRPLTRHPMYTCARPRRHLPWRHCRCPTDRLYVRPRRAGPRRPARLIGTNSLLQSPEI